MILIHTNSTTTYTHLFVAYKLSIAVHASKCFYEVLLIATFKLYIIIVLYGGDADAPAAAQTTPIVTITNLIYIKIRIRID